MRKRNSIKPALFLAVLLCMGSTSEKTPPAIQLEDGDTFVFIGNSITHQCLYTQYIEDYYYTRYPEKRLHFHNAGVSGDVAGDVLVRLNEDILDYQPKYASVLIGMNDGRYQEFSHDIFNRYKQDMSQLVEDLETNEISPILVTPTMYDLRAAINQGDESEFEDPGSMQYNATLGFFGAWLYQVATERGFGYVNMYEPLNRITREARQDQPDFTLIEDAIHPGPGGQLVMALAFLRDVGAGGLVSSIHIDMQNEGWKVVDAENGNLEKLDNNDIRFQFKANSLPWVVPEEASPGYNLTGAGSEMSREVVRITGLDAGEYDLQIDGNVVGTYTHLQFSGGIELQENENTPQYQQAAEIARLNRERNEEAVAPMRDLWLVRKIMKHFTDSPEEFDTEEEAEEIRNWLESEFGLADIGSFLESFPGRLVPLKEKATSFEDQIYNLNKPVTHSYTISENQ